MIGMAKIGTAQVETIHIPDGAVSEYAPIVGSTDSSHFGNQTFSGSVVNDAATPVELWLTGSFEVDSTGSNVQGSGSLSLTRARDGAVLYSGNYSHSTSSQSITPINAQILDISAAANETYTLAISASKSGGAGVVGEKASLNATITLIAARK